MHIVLVTGAASGIGLATVQMFYDQGDAVIAVSHTKGKHVFPTDKFAETDRLLHLDVELQDPESIAAMYDAAWAWKGRVDVVVNNAGVYRNVDFFDATLEDYDYILGTNLRGTFVSCKEAAKRLLAQESESVMINIASVAGIYPRKRHLEYAISKAGIVQLSHCLAAMLAPKVRVHAVCPSVTKTPLMPELQNEDSCGERCKAIPLGRMNMPEDVAASIVFLASPGARNMTGTDVIIDGGRGAAF